jgi:hypothetical protein
MSSDLTSDEVRQDYIATMGDDLGSQFNRLYNECAWLHLKWSEYVWLYGTSPSRIDLLNKSARGFFGLLDSTLWEDILLHLCRLTDDPEVGRRKRQTLSIRRLPTLVEPPIREKLKRLVSGAVRKAEFARDWRDRRIAHQDLELVLKKGVKPLAGASRQKVKEAIAAIVAVLAAVDAHYRRSTTAYEHVSHLGDAEALLHVLRDGIEAQDEQFRRLKAGQISPSDFKPKPPI